MEQTKRKATLGASTFEYKKSTTRTAKLGQGADGKNKGGLVGGLGYVGASILAGFGGMMEGIGDLLVGTAALLSGDKLYAKYIFSKNTVGEWHQKIEDAYQPGAVMDFIGDVGQGIGNSAVMAVPYVGKVAFFAGAIGQGVGEAVQSTGEVGLKEYAYGATVGALEGLLESVIGAGGKAAKSIAGGALKSTVKNGVRNGVVKSVLSSAAGEFAEEFATEYASTFFKRAYQVDPNAQYSFKDAAYAGLVGFVSGGVMSGTTYGISASLNARNGASIRERGNVQTLLNQAKVVNDKIPDGYSFRGEQAVSSLRGSLAAYEKLAASGKENSARGDMLLGEMQAAVAQLEVALQVDQRVQIIKNADEASVAAYAKAASQYLGQEVTADMIRGDVDGVASAVAIVDFVNGVLSDSDALRIQNEVANRMTEERAPVLEGGSDFDENSRVQVWRVGDQYAVVVRNDGESGAVTYSMGLGENADDMRIAQGLSADVVRRQMDKLVSDAKATEQQAGGVSVQGDNPSVTASGDTSLYTREAQASASGEASGQGVALAGGATNGQGMQQNAVESEKKAATRADSKARTQNIRETRGEQYARMAKKTRHEVESSDEYSEYDEPIALKDIESLRSIGRKSVNDFTSEDIKKAQKWAYKFYQELGVKSPFFRAWFGEWRAYDKFKVDVVTVPTIDISQAHLENGNYTIKDTGWTVYAGKTLNDDTRHHSGGNRINVKSLNAINDILNNSVLLDTIVSEPDTKKKSKRTAFLHKLYTAINYNGQKYIAKISVEEYYNETSNNVERRGYNLKAIKIEPIGGQLGTSSSSSVPVIGSVISIADLYGFVKRFDKDFTVAHDVSEAVLNKDGTPKVFYHGTDSDFSSFSYGHIGNATGVGILGDGFYFSDKKSLAEGYGKRLYPCYLQMQNPYFATDNDAYRLNAEKLQQQEYDGVVLEAPKGNVYMVLDNTQIKSAETGENENIGTFDRAEGNIYHSVPSSETSNQQTSDDSAEAKRKARQEQAALAGEAWEASRANREGNLTMIEELRTEERSKRAVKAIPEFEELSPEIRRRVYSMMESAEQNGVDERTQRRLAVLLALDDGLEIRFDEHIRSEGFYSELSGGAALIVVRPDGNEIQRVLMHEFAHELQNQPGYENVRRAILRAVGIKKNGETSEAYEKIKRAVIKDHKAFGEELDAEDVAAEVEARILAQQLGNEKFWRQFERPAGVKGALRRVADFFRALGDRAKRYDTDAAREAAEATRELVKQVNACIEAIGQRSMMGKSARGNTRKARYAVAKDSKGISYWQIETEKDIFKDLTEVKDLQKAAYNFILRGDKGSKVHDLIDGEELEFIRISAGEYVYGEASKNLSETEYKQKMRMSTSVIDLIENASIRYDAPDHKNHKLFPDGFKNYQGRVGIDDTIFKYIVRVGKARNGKIFYDINLEVDAKVPRANRTSLIKNAPTSNHSVPQTEPDVKKNRNFSKEQGEKFVSKAYSYNDARAAVRQARDVIRRASVINGDERWRVELSRDSLTEVTRQAWLAMNTAHDAKSRDKLIGRVAELILDRATLAEIDGKGRMAARSFEYDGKTIGELGAGVSQAMSMVMDVRGDGRGDVVRKQNWYITSAKAGIKTVKRTAKLRGQLDAQKAKTAAERAKANRYNRENPVKERAFRNAKFLADMVSKRDYIAGSMLENEEMKAAIKPLTKIKSTYQLKKNGGEIRRIIRDFGVAFYNSKNDMFTDADSRANSDGEKWVIRPEIVEDIALLTKNAESDADLTLEEFEAVDRILQEAARIYREYGTAVVGGRRVVVKQHAKEIYEDLQISHASTSGNVKSGAVGWLRRMGEVVKKVYTYQILDPRSVIRAMEGYSNKGMLSQLFDDVRMGEVNAKVTLIDLVKPMEEFFRENKGYEKRLKSGKIVFDGHEMSVGQAISLYELSMREQAKEHLAEGGIKWDGADGEVRELKTLTKAQLDDIKRQLTAKDHEYIRIVEDFFNRRAKAVKEEADGRILGYTNTVGGHYFPIKVDQTEIAVDISNLSRVMQQQIMTVYNASFNKNTVEGARNQVIVGNVFDVVYGHARMLANYAQLYLPMSAFSKVYNARVEIGPGMQSTVRKYLERVWRKNGATQSDGFEKYMSRLFADLQGIGRDKNSIERVIETVRGGWFTATLGLNVGTAAKQITSLPMALAHPDVDMDCFMRAFTLPSGKEMYAKMDKYCALAYAKHYEGGAAAALGVVDKVRGLGQKTMFMIEGMDRQLTCRIFCIAQMQIQKDKGYAIGTEQNLKAAGELAMRIMFDTQSGYTVTERSGAMRSSSEIVRAMTMFTSDAMKHFSRIFDAFGEYTAARRRVKRDRSDTNVQAWRQARKQVGKVLGAHAASTALLVAVTQLFKWLYDKDRDEGETLAEDILGDALSSELGMLPGVADVVSFFMDGYDVSHFTYDMLNDVLGNVRNLSTLAGQAIGGEEISSTKLNSELRKLVFNLGTLTGIPIKNVHTTLYGLTKRFDSATAYKYNALFYDARAKDLQAALDTGDIRLATTVYDILLTDKVGKTEERAVKIMLQLYKAGYDDIMPRDVPDQLTVKGETDEDADVVVYLKATQKRKFEEIYGSASEAVAAMISGERFWTLEAEQQADAIRRLYDSYYNEAAHEVAGVKVSTLNALEVLCDRELLVLSKAAISAMEADVDKKGNAVSGSRKKKVLAYVKTLKLPKGQAEVVLYLNGYRGDVVLGAVARYANGAGLSEEELADIAELLGGSVRRGKIVLK